MRISTHGTQLGSPSQSDWGTMSTKGTWNHVFTTKYLRMLEQSKVSARLVEDHEYLPDSDPRKTLVDLYDPADRRIGLDTKLANDAVIDGNQDERRSSLGQLGSRHQPAS